VEECPQTACPIVVAIGQGVLEPGTMDVDTILKVIVGVAVGLLFAAKPINDFVRRIRFPNRKKSE
jgi:hypothetical protein